MFGWFTKTLSIQKKFEMIAATLVVIAMLFCASGYGMVLYDPPVGYLFVGLYALLGISPIFLVLIAGKLIGSPVTALMFRIEALVEGDVDSPIPYADQRDCVGRLAKAASILRDRAKSAAQAREEAAMADRLGRGLWLLAQGRSVDFIEQPFPEDYEQLRLGFNAVAALLTKPDGTTANSAVSSNSVAKPTRGPVTLTRTARGDGRGETSVSAAR